MKNDQKWFKIFALKVKTVITAVVMLSVMLTGNPVQASCESAGCVTAGSDLSMSMAAEYSLIVGGTDASPVCMQDQTTGGKDIFKSARRYRQIDLMKQITQAGDIVNGDVLVLDLFPGTTYHATVDRVSVDVQGSITIRGRLRNYPLGYVLITSTGNISFVSIHVPEQNREFRIVYDTESRSHYVLEIDPLKKEKMTDGPAVIPPPPTPEEQREIDALQRRVGSDQSAAITQIDIMIVYTPAAKQWADSNGGIGNLITQSMGKAQLVADNSLTDIKYNLVHTSEISYTESGKTDTDLDRLQKNGDGYLDSVHPLRDAYGADLVVLFLKIEKEDIAGLGFQLSSVSGEPAYGFSLTGIQNADDYTNIHEIGHNMGANHHKQQKEQPADGLLFPYSAGWRWISTDTKAYCSVMTYEDGKYFADGVTHTAVGYFSNPAVTHIGAATGDAVNGDNARTLRETKNIVAAYRPSTMGCTAKIDSNLSLHIPLISHVNPQSGISSYLSADFAYKYDPAFPTVILFKLVTAAIVQIGPFTCSPSTLSNDLTIHIPSLLLPNGTRMWVDLAYNPSLSTDGNVYFFVSKHGVIS